MKTIGVAIPCYKYHIDKVNNLLESIELQIRKPDQVCISCSSTEENTNILKREYSFPVKTLIWNDRKNASQNRNLAIKELDADIISFFDADDIMHPQRLDFIEKAFLQYPSTNIVVHNFSEKKEPFQLYKEPNLLQNSLAYNMSGIGLVYIPNSSAGIHHSQSSVRKDILARVWHRENKEYERMEDSIFCNDVLRMFGESVYIPNILSQYYPEGAWY
jgi:glycosyltransferase involved in cell wall biosynthesis